MRAITVIGTNVVIDCETVEEAVAYMDRLAATPAPLDVLVAARAVVDAWEETVTATVISRTNWAIERLRYALATPAPLDGPYTVAKIEYAADDFWDVLDANGEKIALCGEADARMIAAALNAATPAPLDVEREALRRQHLEETHRASGSCPGWTCPTARVLALLMEPKP